MNITTPFKVSLLASAIALTGCGGDSSDSETAVDGGGRTGIDVNSFTISAQGGASTLGQGGSGGGVSVYKYNSPSALNIAKQGVISSAYTLPEQTPHFGSNPATVSTSETVQLVYVSNDESDTSTHLPDAGKLYLVDYTMVSENPDISYDNVYRLYKSDGLSALGAENTEVTGLTINEGASLILRSNNSNNTINLYFKNDVENNGLLITENENAAHLDLEIYTGAYYGSGDIDLSGTKLGQSGGDLSIYAHTIKNSGDLNTSGATNNTDGNAGSGGYIRLSANIFIENNGQLNTRGGTSALYMGGDAGSVYINAMEVFNNGAIDAQKGAGRDANYSSNSTDIEIYAGKTLINTADISVQGGEAHGDGSYNAGKGGTIELMLGSVESVLGLDKALVNTGNLNANGGAVAGDAYGRGGYGGTISIYAGDEYLIDSDDPNSYEASSLATSINISGNLSANGGSTESADSYATAGNGGYIYLAAYDQATSSTDSNLLGYTSINVSAGDGLNGGYGGWIDLVSGDYRDERGGSYVPAFSGPINNGANLVANGGSSLAVETAGEEEEQRGYGRRAGSVYLAIENGYGYLQPGELNLTNTGSITADGGRSFNDYNSANGGDLWVSAPGSVSLSNDISLNGGSDEHVADSSDNDDHRGSDGGDLALISQYDSSSLDGAISLNGGSGDLVGGDAGFVMINAKTALTANGTIAMNGGDAIANDTDSHETIGGDAGYINLLSAAYNSELASTVTAQAGTGDESGEPTSIVVDADCQSNYCDLQDSMGIR